jgi:hypothetical protein
MHALTYIPILDIHQTEHILFSKIKNHEWTFKMKFLSSYHFFKIENQNCDGHFF